MRIYTFLCVLMLFCCAPLHSQTSAEERAEAMRRFLKFPVNIRFAQDYVSGHDYEMEVDDVIMNEGRMGDAFRTTLNLSMPVYKSKAGYLTFGGFYNYHNVGFAPRVSGAGVWHPDMGREHHTWGLQSAYMFGSKLWGKKFTGITNIKGEFSGDGLERVTGVAVGMLQLRRSARSSFGLGAVLLLNTSSPWPLFPFVTYSCNLDERWTLDLVMPQFYLKYKLSARDRLMGGFSIFGEHFYVKPEREELPRVCLYSRSNFRPEIVYEHSFDAITKFFVKGGAALCINSRLYSSGGNTRYVDISQRPSPFIQMGVSYGMGGF